VGISSGDSFFEFNPILSFRVSRETSDLSTRGNYCFIRDSLPGVGPKIGRRYVGETSTAIDFQVLVYFKKSGYCMKYPGILSVYAAINKTENLLRVTGEVETLGRI
jgi:hypothetical protein